VANREYVIAITNLQNPAFTASGNIKVYSSDYNSYVPLESDENVALSTVLSTLTCSATLSSGLRGATAYAGYYSGMRQNLLFSCSSTVAIPAGLALTLSFSAGTLVAGSGFMLNYPSATFTYSSDTSLTIQSMPALGASTAFTLQLTLLQPASTLTVTLAGQLSTSRTTLRGASISTTSQLFTGSTSISGQMTQTLPSGLVVNPSSPQKVHEMGTPFVLQLSGTSATGQGSRLIILLPGTVTASSPTCTVSNPSANSVSCNVASSSTALQLSFNSSLSENLFPNSQVTVSITGLTFPAASAQTRGEY
jgi:hypothetical protein